MPKKIFLGLAAIIFGIALVLGVFVAYGARDKEDTFALADAEFADVGYLQHSGFDNDERSRRLGDFSVYAHRLKRGAGTVFGFRAYSPGRVGIIDDETYRKITVWIAHPLPASTLEMPFGDDTRAIMAVSEGSSAWPRSGCSRVATAGTVQVQRTHGRCRITIHADTMVSGKITPIDCAAEKVDLTFEAKEIAFDELTPWLGLEGLHPYDETYRRVW